MVRIDSDGLTCVHDDGTTIELKSFNGEPSLILRRSPDVANAVLTLKKDGATHFFLANEKGTPIMRISGDHQEGGKIMVAGPNGFVGVIVKMVQGQFGSIAALAADQPMFSQLYWRGFSTLDRDLRVFMHIGSDEKSSPLCVFWDKKEQETFSVKSSATATSELRMAGKDATPAVLLSGGVHGGVLQLNDSEGKSLIDLPPKNDRK